MALRTLYERFPDLEVAGTPRRRSTQTLRGYHAIPVATGASRPVRTAS